MTITSSDFFRHSCKRSLVNVLQVVCNRLTLYFFDVRIHGSFGKHVHYKIISIVKQLI